MFEIFKKLIASFSLPSAAGENEHAGGLVNQATRLGKPVDNHSVHYDTLFFLSQSVVEKSEPKVGGRAHRHSLSSVYTASEWSYRHSLSTCHSTRCSHSYFNSNSSVSHPYFLLCAYSHETGSIYFINVLILPIDLATGTHQCFDDNTI